MRRLRTFLIWLGFVFLTVTFFAARRLTHGFAAVLAVFFYAGAVIGLFLLFLVPRRKGVRLHYRGSTLMMQGRMQAALEAFEGAARLLPITGASVGFVRLNLWDVPLARAALEKAWRSRTLTTPRSHIAAYLCLAAALEEDAAAAARWLEEAKKLQADTTAPALLGSAVLACRAGDWASAHALLERYENNALSGPVRGLREALRAWVADQGFGEKWPVDAVALFGEVGPERLQKLWPEFVAFVQSSQGIRARVSSGGVTSA